MMLKKTLLILPLVLTYFISVAQESPTASGGEATGTGGAVNYSVGQIVYTTATGTNGSVAQGVQQPFEISVTTGIEKTAINLELSVYPNPTSNFLTLKVADFEGSILGYQLVDMQGKLLKSKENIGNTSTINMDELPKAIYFLTVRDEKQLVKTFKIIKN